MQVSFSRLSVRLALPSYCSYQWAAIFLYGCGRRNRRRKSHKQLLWTVRSIFAAFLGWQHSLPLSWFFLSWLPEFFGASGTYVVAALSAMADVDAIALSLARQAYRELPVEIATGGIGIAVAVNTITKAGMAMLVGDRRFGLIVSGASAAAIVLGATVWLLRPFPL